MNDDLISRQAAIDAAKKLLDYYGTNDISKEFADHTAEQFMNRVPSAQPDRKTGRWIEMGQNEDGTHNICCGVCGKFKIKSRGHANSAYTKSKYRFCGGCGAKMGVEHETD